MDFNRRPDGSCPNHNCGCGEPLRASAKRRRIDEPDGEPIYYCSNCNCRMHEVSTSGEDEEFSDEGDGMEREPQEINPGGMFVSGAAGLQQLQLEGQNVSSTAAGALVVVDQNQAVASASSGPPALPAPLQSPTTPPASGSGSSSGAGGNISGTLSRVDELGWQENRPTLTARAGYLLNNVRMSDVKFLVEEGKVEIYGHKTILALGSPVFEAQFFGAVGSGSTDVIELPDMEPETFVMFLKYLYTDELETCLDDSQLLCLLRPAKKYIVPHLVDKCSDILMTELKPENIFQILHHAQFYELLKLEGACHRYIDRYSAAIVTSEEFTNLGKTILIEFLKRDGLNINENALFKGVLRWATAECQRNSTDPTNDNLRLALGDCLKLIRFPTMTKEEFASVFETTSILSPEEACSVFVYMCKSSPHNSMSPALMFPKMKRHFAPHLCIVSRFSGEPTEHSLNYRSGEIYNYRINFKVDRHVFLKGVNIFSIRCGPQVMYHTHKRDFSGALYLYEKGAPSNEGRKQFNKQGSLEPDESATSVNGIGRRQFYPVLFDSEIALSPGKTYTVCVVVSVNSHSYPAQPLHTYVGTSERNKSAVVYSPDLSINFTFLGSSVDGSVGRFTSAQIPELIFCL